MLSGMQASVQSGMHTCKQTCLQEECVHAGRQARRPARINACEQSGRRASEVLHVFDPVPQLLKNVRFSAGQAPLELDSVKLAIREAEAQLSGNGRLLIRKSGTEPLIRVMAESEDEALLNASVEHVVSTVESAVGTVAS